MNRIKVQDADFVFLSYDEPNADRNYADLKKKFPWAKRVHAVKGLDAAHKACANISETERFITIDADTIVDKNFLDVEIDLDALGLDNTYQFSWCGKIAMNGLMYGNGSLKMWTKDFVKNMKTHEIHDGKDKNAIEFSHFPNYYQFNENYSTSYVNASPYQAWRSGFREGVKMSIDRYVRVPRLKDIWWQNYHRLLVWMSVGADVENGLWAIYGARLGCYNITCTDWDLMYTRDFQYLLEEWQSNPSGPIFHRNAILNEENTLGRGHSKLTEEELITRITQMGQDIKNREEIDIPVLPLTPEQSKFFKSVYMNSPRIFKKRTL